MRILVIADEPVELKLASDKPLNTRTLPQILSDVVAEESS